MLCSLSHKTPRSDAGLTSSHPPRCRYPQQVQPILHRPPQDLDDREHHGARSAGEIPSVDHMRRTIHRRALTIYIMMYIIDT